MKLRVTFSNIPQILSVGRAVTLVEDSGSLYFFDPVDSDWPIIGLENSSISPILEGDVQRFGCSGSVEYEAAPHRLLIIVDHDDS